MSFCDEEGGEPESGRKHEKEHALADTLGYSKHMGHHEILPEITSIHMSKHGSIRIFSKKERVQFSNL